VSEDGEQNAFLVVDAVDRILHCHDQELRPLPALPKSLRAICDGLLREADGRVLIRVRANASWPMPTRSEKRNFIDALIRLSPEADEGLPCILP
jgi:chemotaxis signal transduction protein